MHTYTDARGLLPGRFTPLSRLDLVWLKIISNSNERRNLDDNFGEEDDDSDSDVDEEGGLFTMI